MPAKKGTTKQGATKKGASTESAKGSGKRELIAPNGDKRYIKRDDKGRITESDDQGTSLARDVRQPAKTKVKPGYGDQGDHLRKKATAKKSPTKSGSKKG